MWSRCAGAIAGVPAGKKKSSAGERVSVRDDMEEAAFNRLSKDYQGHIHLSRAWLLWAMTDKMLRTLLEAAFVLQRRNQTLILW
jgi:hypothetical protein